MSIYKFLVKPILFLFNPECAHKFVISFIKLKLIKLFLKVFYNDKKTYKESFEYKNLFFKNRIGLAAGLDKDAEVVESLSYLGFGFIEVGTVTPKAQEGNPKPRLFRLIKDSALINRMGFNNLGAENMIKNLKKMKKKNCIIGINIGKNMVTPIEEAYKDYTYCLDKLYDYGDYFAVNISSPNTPNLRELQKSENFQLILQKLSELRDQKNTYKPIFVKIAPDIDMDTLYNIIENVKKFGIDGIIATNTTINRENLKSKKFINEKGGLSGKPLKNKSNEIIKYIKQHSEDKFLIIGVGGVFDYNDYKEKRELGADLVQVYTSFIYEGPRLVFNILNKI